MSDGFVGRMLEAKPRHRVCPDTPDFDGFTAVVWVQPLVPGEPKPGEVWMAPDGPVTVTRPPYNSLNVLRYVPTDNGAYRIERLRPIPAHPWHRRADGSAEGLDTEPRGWQQRCLHGVAKGFIRRGKCDRKRDRRKDDDRG